MTTLRQAIKKASIAEASGIEMTTLRQALKKSGWKNFKEVSGDNCNYDSWNVSDLLNEIQEGESDNWLDSRCWHDDLFVYIIDCFGTELIELKEEGE